MSEGDSKTREECKDTDAAPKRTIFAERRERETVLVEWMVTGASFAVAAAEQIEHQHEPVPLVERGTVEPLQLQDP